MNNTVELIGYYGGDETHAASAWTSTDHSKVETEKARIPALLKNLAENGHHTPFEKSSLHFLVTCDIASHIHLIKHRIGVSVNAESARYKELKEDKYYIPEDWDYVWKTLAGKPHGTGDGLYWMERLQRHCEASIEAYHKCLEDLTPILGRKRAKESARYFLPYTTQITADVMFNFRSFMHFQELRNDEHAQLEIHRIAEKMLELIRETGAFKYSLEAFGY